MNRRITTARVVVLLGATNVARAGTGSDAECASSTNAPYNAALAAAAKYFGCKEGRIVLRFVSDLGNRLQFSAIKHPRAVGVVRVEFEDRGQDFTHFDVVQQDGQIIDCRPFQYTTWAQFQVTNVGDLRVGGHAIVKTPRAGTLTIAYAIVKLVQIGGAR